MVGVPKNDVAHGNGPSRRSVLVAGVGVAGALTLAGCAAYPGLDAVLGPWDAGVASGLHAPDAAVLWTRFSPAALSTVELGWEVAVDPGFATVIASGNVTVGPDTDGCAKVLAEGLVPGSHHWYRFYAGVSPAAGDVSPAGRTKTLPEVDSTPGSLRLAVGSCQDFSSGWYPAWREIVATELDAVIFLGDYIYESAGRPNPLWGVRDDTSAGAVDLATYRAKYRMYRTDRDLRAAHSAHPFAPVWDDHEFVNNCDRQTIADLPARAAAAYRAWFEYQPVWPIDGSRIHRRLRFGRLADLSLLDTRQYRDPNPSGGDLLRITTERPASVVHDAGRTMLGAPQRDWLLEGLGVAQGDGVTWKVLGQQVMMAPLRWIDLDEPVFGDHPRHAGLYFNLDQWDGYSAERDLVTGFLDGEGIANTTILTGDIHSFWQASIHTDMEDFSSPAVAQEFVCGSISSTALGFSPDLAQAFGALTKGFSPAFRWVDWEHRGYGLLEATSDSMNVQYRVVDPLVRSSVPRKGVAFDWAAGTDEVVISR